MNMIRILILSLLFLALSAHAAGDVPDRSTAITIEPVASGQGFSTLAWTQDAGGSITMLGEQHLVRLPFGSGSPQIQALRGRAYDVTDAPRHLATTDAGNLIGTLEHDCSVESIGPDGQLRWRATPFPPTSCLLSRPLVRGNLNIVAARAIAGESLVAASLSDQGQQQWRTVLAATNLFMYSPPLLVDDGNYFYVVAAHLSGNNLVGVEVFVLGEDGNLHGRWSSPANEGLRLSNVVARTGGGLEVAVLDELNRVVLFRIGAGGALDLRRTLDAGAVSGTAFPRSDGGGYILSSPNAGGQPTELRGYLASGNVVWAKVLEQICPGFRAQCAWRAENEDLFIAGHAEPNVLERYSPDGTRRFVRIFNVPGVIQRPLFALPGSDGLVVVGVRNWHNDGGSYEHLEWLNSNGEVVEQRQLPDESSAMPPAPRQFAIDNDGAITVVVERPETIPTRRVRVDPEGEIEFDLPLPDDLGRVVATARCGDHGTCIAGMGAAFSVYRFDGDSVLPVWQLEIDADPRPRGVLIRPLDGGDFDLIETFFSTGLPGGPAPIFSQRLSRISADGSLRQQRTFGIANQGLGLLVAHSQTGAYAILSGNGVLRHIDDDGVETTHQLELPFAYRGAVRPVPGIVASSGTTTYVAVRTQGSDSQGWPLSLVSVATDGSTRETSLGVWPHVADLGPDDHSPTSGPVLAAPSVIGIAPLGDDDVIVGLEQTVLDGRGFHAELVRIGANGDALWRRSWNNRDEYGFELVVDGDDRILLSSRRSDGGWVARTLSPDGVLLDQRQPRCAEGPCRIDLAALSPNGTVLGVGRSGGEDQPHGHRVWQLRGMFEPDAVALDAPGLTGTWYNPASAGQGFTLRRYPNDDGGAVFLPWFTFSSHGGNDSDSLRWYTIQGPIEPGQNQVTLPLLANTGGRFDAPPVTEPQVVGQVRLRFADCARGVLDYRFDPDHGGAEGSIALQRLLPPALACGDVEPATHDPLLSASWYDPATSGQGLDLYRIAGSNDSATVLFGSWYTYAPTAPTGTTADQRWFTLQGIADSGDGGWVTTIVQTLGGRLDGQPTWNHFRVGEAVLRSVDCQQLRLQYRFDDTEEAGNFRDLDGTIELQRIGDCPATP